MKLYHGTSDRHLASILEHGIRPRAEGESGNWKEFPSIPGHVYLTTAYAPYFAINATEEGEKCLVVEIDTGYDEPEIAFGELAMNMYPDEDWIAQSFCTKEFAPFYTSLEKTHKIVVDSIEKWRHFADYSVRKIGNCSYRGTIPPHFISRYAIFDMNSAEQSFTWACVDPSITEANYAFCGAKYRGLTAWLFGDREVLPSIHDGIGLDDSEVSDFFRESIERNKEASKNRTGITVTGNYYGGSSS